MDVPRIARPRRLRFVLPAAAGVLLLLVTLGVSRLRPAAPEVERSAVWTDVVKRGTMVRDVRANGTLVPENQRYVSAMTAGRVERVLVRPGTKVEATTLLMQLSNPDVELQALDADRQVKLAEADLASLEAALEGQRLVAVTDVAAAKNDLQEAERGVAVAERLTSEGLASAMETARARDKAEQAHTTFESQQRRLKVLANALAAQLALRRSELDRLRSIARFQRERVTSMQVMSGAAGVVQELSLQPGQWVNPGQSLARVAGLERLKAVVQVPETQARDLALGLPATIDTRNGIVHGHVSRVDPAVQNGSVAVDLALDDSLPRGARPDLSVDATIEIDRIPNALYVGRPADGSSEATVGLFKLDSDGRNARRVPVKLGRGSANAVEVLEGLKEGDRLILSDMTRWDNANRVHLR